MNAKIIRMLKFPFGGNVTSVRPIPMLEDDLWYPILVNRGGYCVIKEMQGRDVNAYNGVFNEFTLKERVTKLANIWANDKYERGNTYFVFSEQALQVFAENLIKGTLTK